MRILYPLHSIRQFDEIINPFDGIRDLIGIKGIKRILTSGGKPTAKEGSEKIREMRKVAGSNIIILVAGKVNKLNVNDIKKLTGANEFHGKKIVG